MEVCVLNSEIDVDSDLDETCHFMVEDQSRSKFFGSDSEVGDKNEDQEQEAFAIQQLFGGKNGMENEVGDAYNVLNE